MNFNDYQKEARKTAIYPDVDHNLIYPVLGLTSEAGEVSQILKRMIRDGQPEQWGLLDTSTKVDEYVHELGDCLWYIANIASELNINLDWVAKQNLKKLNDRKDRGKLSGHGDNR